MEEKQLKRNLILFPVGTIGRDAIYYLFTNCLMTFVLFTRTLTNAQFGAITAIVVAARIFDGLNDPIMGNIIEQTRTRWGKFKPWLVIGIISTSVVVYLAFNTNLQGWSFVWFFGIIYFLYSITYTMHDISYWGLIPALSSDANRRNQFTSRATLCAGIGGTLASVLIPMYTIGSNAIGGNTASAYGTIALITCILAPLFLAFTIFGVREHRDDKPAEVKAFNFREVIQTLTQNDQVKWIALIFLIQQIGNGLIIGGLGATYIYFDYGYEGGLFSTFSIIGMFPTALLMIFYPAISRKIHRKDLMKIMAGIAMVGYGLMLIAAFFLPSSMMKFWVVVAGYALSNFGQYCYYLIMMISIINTVEYNEYKFGKREEAIISSLRPFLTKMGSALIVLLTNLSYIIFGVTRYTNQISDLENQAARNLITESDKLSAISDVVHSATHGEVMELLLFMAIVPAACMILAYVLYKKHYKLDEEEYDRICKELEKRK